MNQVVEKLKSSLNNQCEVCGVTSVCGKHVGASLVSIETGEVVSKEQLQDALRNRDENLVVKDTATGLLIPGSSTRMKTASGSSIRIPPNHAINPDTGHVVPIQGNVCFDVVSNSLVFTCDCPSKRNSRDCMLHESPMIPFIPHPVDTETGEPVETRLKAVEQLSGLKAGGPMVDPTTGLTVPVCAVTIHPHSHSLLPVGGTYTDPVSNLPAPIELGSILLDPVTNAPCPIVGVTIDSITGRVRPVGGSMHIEESNSSSASQKMILIGDGVTEPLSQLPVLVTSAVVGREDECDSLKPAVGGYQTYVDSVELLQEKTVLKTLVYLRDLGHAASDNGGDRIFSEELKKAHSIYNKMINSRKVNQTMYLTNLHRLLVKKESCDQLSSTGGSPGYMEFKPTGQPLPLLLGYSIPDEVEGLKVPVLGYELHPVTGVAEPLAGTFESSDGRGRIPIMIGEKCYDEASKDLAPICGAKRNPETGVVVPMVQDCTHSTQAKRTVAKSVVSEVVIDIITIA